MITPGMLQALCGVLGIEPKSTEYKVSALPTVLSARTANMYFLEKHLFYWRNIVFIMKEQKKPKHLKIYLRA